MSFPMQNTANAQAIVARPPMRPSDADQYLLLTAKGAAWTTDPLAATAFESMREATRAAMRLPSAVRAFGMPLRSEVEAHSLH